MSKRIGLIDVDGHHFPNLALMRISAWHKLQGDLVEWWFGDIVHYDIVYMSKVFSDAYSPDIPEPINAERVVKGGTGYSISSAEGREVFNTHTHTQLPEYMERMFPDYSIYPQHDFAVSMTSRGCPRGCGFCHVAAKEGRCAVKVANVSDFWNGQKEIKVLDANLTACADKRDLCQQYAETGAMIDFTQGLDIRLLDDADIADLNKMRLRTIHFAWDNPKDDLLERFENFARGFRRKSNVAMVYVRVNYNSTMQENLHRIYSLRQLGYDPYVMVYDKPNAPQEIRHLQRWCNSKYIFKSVPCFEDYMKTESAEDSAQYSLFDA